MHRQTEPSMHRRESEKEGLLLDSESCCPRGSARAMPTSRGSGSPWVGRSAMVLHRLLTLTPAPCGREEKVPYFKQNPVSSFSSHGTQHHFHLISTSRAIAVQNRYRILSSAGQRPETMIIGCCDRWHLCWLGSYFPNALHLRVWLCCCVLALVSVVLCVVV